MRIKTPKPHSGLSKNIKSFTLNSILLNRTNYMPLFVICLHCYPINIVSDPLYSVFVLKNIKTSTINSNQPIIQQLFFELQFVIKNRTSPIHITHIRAHHTLKLQIKKLKGEYTGTLLSSLSKADFTRFQHKIFSKPITIVNTALFVLNFLNIPQGNILTRAEMHFEELKDTYLPLPIW